MNPFNPLNWINTAQNWFTRTEKSSGFRPLLIFIILQLGFVFIVFTFFPGITLLVQFALLSLYFTFALFGLIYIIKSFQDPSFCRSEKHVESIRRIEMMERKGDTGPTIIDVSSMKNVAKEEAKALLQIKKGDK